jgi:c-di-GMP-binding flagellar brake protein YcgR
MTSAAESGFPITSKGVNRRLNDRFPIVRELRYRVLGGRENSPWGSGRTLDISSTGVLFSAETPLPAGKRLELSISWPAQLDGKCAMKFVARGRVKRCRGTEVAIAIDKYEFRTQGSRGLLPQS